MKRTETLLKPTVRSLRSTSKPPQLHLKPPFSRFGPISTRRNPKDSRALTPRFADSTLSRSLARSTSVARSKLSAGYGGFRGHSALKRVRWITESFLDSRLGATEADFESFLRFGHRQRLRGSSRISRDCGRLGKLLEREEDMIAAGQRLGYMDLRVKQLRQVHSLKACREKRFFEDRDRSSENLDSPLEVVQLSSDAQINNYYDIQNKLGFGTYGQVFKARCHQTGEKVAIKVMEKVGQTHYKREIEMLKRIRGFSGCVNLKKVLVSRQAVYLVTELLQGGDLFDYVKENNVYARTMTLRTALELTRSMLLALEACHVKDFAHLDVKPENFVFRTQPPKGESSSGAIEAPKGTLSSAIDTMSKLSLEHVPHGTEPKKPEPFPQLVLVDFGAAQPFVRRPFARTNQMYIAGMDEFWIGEADSKIGGTANYSSPEVVIESRFSSRSDVWSMGVTLYMLLTGQRPFDFNAEVEGESLRMFKAHSKALTLSPDELIQKKIHLDATGNRTDSIFHTCPDIRDLKNENIKSLLRAMTNPDPSQRPSSTESIQTIDKILLTDFR